jgi:hypothetical protein
MAISDKDLAPQMRLNLGSLTTSAGNESNRVQSPSGLATLPTSNIQKFKLTGRIGPAIVFRPLGIDWVTTTTTTVTAPVLTLRKNGANVTGATVTIPLAAAGVADTFGAFPDYSANIGTDAVGDSWSVFVSTTSTAGVISVWLWVACIVVPGINAGLQY